MFVVVCLRIVKRTLGLLEWKMLKKLRTNRLKTSRKLLQAEHAEELTFLGYNSKNVNEKGNLDNLVQAITGVSVINQPDHAKPSKSTRRRGKRAQEEAEREQRIQEEQSNIISDRAIENEKLEKKA